MSAIEKPGDVGLIVLTPDEALRSALGLPSSEDLSIEGLTSDEWSALQTALAEQ